MNCSVYLLWKKDENALTSSNDPARLRVAAWIGDGVTGAGDGVGTGESGEKGVVSGLENDVGAALVGVGKLDVFAIGGATRGARQGTEGGAESGDWVPAKTVPLSRLTRLGATILPAKNSPAERAGSEDGAGGKISDWKLSAYDGQNQYYPNLVVFKASLPSGEQWRRLVRWRNQRLCTHEQFRSRKHSMHAGEGSTCHVADLKTCVRRAHAGYHFRIHNSECSRLYVNGNINPKQYQQ